MRHQARYMMFNRILAAVEQAIQVFVQEEWRQPSGSLHGLRHFDVNRVEVATERIKPSGTQAGSPGLSLAAHSGGGYSRASRVHSWARRAHVLGEI